MRRKTFDALMTTGGLVIAVLLVVAGSLLMWAHNFTDSSVRSQLVEQQIFFPKANTPALTSDPEIARYVTPYAGKQVVNGKQAEVFADHYIKVHLNGVAGGQTYSQVSSKLIAVTAVNPNDPAIAALTGQKQTLFQGETLRGLLLNAYAFGKVGSIAGIAAISSFIAAAVMLVLSALGYWHLRRVAADAEVLPNLVAAPAVPAHA